MVRPVPDVRVACSGHVVEHEDAAWSVSAGQVGQHPREGSARVARAEAAQGVVQATLGGSGCVRRTIMSRWEVSRQVSDPCRPTVRGSDARSPP